jgi:hypothetical protein
MFIHVMYSSYLDHTIANLELSRLDFPLSIGQEKGGGVINNDDYLFSPRNKCRMSCFTGRRNLRVGHPVSSSWRGAIATGSFRFRRLDTNRSISTSPIRDQVVRLEEAANTITEVAESAAEEEVAEVSSEVAAASRNR